LSIAIDGEGGIWVIQRPGTTSQVLRFTRSFTLETFAPVGTNTQGLDDFTGYAYAHIVDPNGDNDGDGEANLQELKNGTNPFHPESYSRSDLDLTGAQFQGQKLTMSLARSVIPPAPGLLFLGLRGKTPLRVPGVFGGTFEVDLSTFLPLISGIVLQTTPLTLTIPLPNDNALVGKPLLGQGLVVDSTLSPQIRMTESADFTIH